MSSTQDAQDEPVALSESQLQRPDPEAILADEADPIDVLGEETVSEKGAAQAAISNGQEEADTKRNSVASAIFSNDSVEAPPTSSSLPMTDVNASGNVVKQLQDQIKDLTNQVTGLNEKLVKSFNRMADVEDDYSDAQEKVRSTSTRIAELEKERAEHLDALNTGLLVEKVHVSSEMQRMMDRVIEETAQRGKAESDKTKIEAELDELSSSLFSEANKMVAVERLSRARAEEKSRNMEERLKDTEGIMLEQQKVLADLQHQVEKLQASSSVSHQAAGDDAISGASDNASVHLLTTSSLARSMSQRTVGMQRKHLPVADTSSEVCLQINIVPYQEFKAFILHLRKLRMQLAPFYNYPLDEASDRTPTPRITSPVPQRAVTPSGASSAYSQGLGSSLPTSSPFTAAGVSRHRDYPSLPSNVENLVQLPNQLSLPFIKRSQEEDIDPCLRLDFAPGLNWLSRRQANTAILDGNLVIEPLFSGGSLVDGDAVRRAHAHLPPAACAMCGIPIVNVPLPGGAATNASSTAEQSSKSTATSSWASSAASSLSSITGSSNSTTTLTPKASRAGLFSSFRKASYQSTKSSESETPTPGQSVDTESNTVTEILISPDIPVPTHIFRLSDNAPTRYLLCPHHCLLRLRAACQYWGFIRNLERSVVLEGKFVSEERIAASVNASTADLVSDSVREQSSTVDTLERAIVDVDDSRTDKDTADKEQSAKAEAHDADVLKDSGAISATQETPGTVSEPEEGVIKDDSFADAPSSPSEAETRALGNSDAAAIPDQADTNNENETTGSTSEKETAETEQNPDVEAKGDEGVAEVTPESLAVPPPVPARSAARASGTTSPAPTLPPRRPPRAPNSSEKALPRVAPTVKFTSPAVTTLHLSNLDAMEWEDKMWTEITKLKEELWKARIGLICDNTATQ